jgi:hypothetical protein
MSKRMIRIAALASVSLCVFASTAQAEELAASPMVAARVAFENQMTPGFGALAKRGATFEGVLALDALPGGGWAAEVEVSYKNLSVRYPVKFQRAEVEGCANWTVSWTPNEAFSTALLNVASSGALPEAPSAREWSEHARLPALPILLTRDKMITPYGAVDIQRELAELDTSQKGASIAPPPSLVKHTKKWLEEYLENDEGAASVDVIADRRATWQDLTRVVFGTSSVGFYKLYLVASREDGSLGAIETAAPIFGSLPGVKKPVPLVLGYYPLEQGSGFRVSQGSAVLEDKDACADEMSFCVADGGEFDKRLAALAAGMRAKKPDNPSYAMFATTGDVTVGAAVAWLERVGAGLSIPQRRVFIGYIER